MSDAMFGEPRNDLGELVQWLTVCIRIHALSQLFLAG